MTDFRQDKAIYRQMSDRLCDDILSGRYGAGDRIPSVRELSEMLEVNTNTVVRAYDQLTRQGIVFTRRGMGYFVSENGLLRIGKRPRHHHGKQTEGIHGRKAAGPFPPDETSRNPDRNSGEAVGKSS